MSVVKLIKEIQKKKLEEHNSEEYKERKRLWESENRTKLPKYEDLLSELHHRPNIEEKVMLKTLEDEPNLHLFIDREYDSNENIFFLVYSGIGPTRANAYPKSFSINDIIESVNEKLTPKLIKLYPEQFKPRTLFQIHKWGIRPEEISDADLINYLMHMITIDTVKATSSCKFVAMGAKGIILKGGDSILKFTKEFMYEAEMYRKVTSINPKNIIKTLNLPNDEYIKGFSKERMEDMSWSGYFYPFTDPEIYIELEYIKGKTLQQHLLKRRSLSEKKILRYSEGILNGLIEMRRAGIWYHRDLRPANIIIDADRDEAVIIDLGIATTDKDALPKDNRRYGGPNDLVSLGQIIYKMATGGHIFSESQSMTRTFSDIADEIRDYRTKVYADTTGKLINYHLRRVDETIPNEKVRVITKECLTAGKDDHQRIYEMLKR